MGLLPLADPPLAVDSTRGEKVYAANCASCHTEDGQGEPNKSSKVGYSIPPLWGDDSFNAAAGMAKLAYAAAYVRAKHAFRCPLSGSGALGGAGMGRCGLYDLQTTAAGPAGSRIRPALMAGEDNHRLAQFLRLIERQEVATVF